MEGDTGFDRAERSTGCLVCGRELYYTPELPLLAKCQECGKEEITHVFCPEGHYICDECHRRDILDRVEQLCADSGLTDPAALAAQIFRLKNLHMHGPEYHSIVPAVLVTAYGNLTGQKNLPLIREAIERGKSLGGGFCASHGACGAGIGAGIAYAVLHGVTPYSAEERGRANRMTALTLEEIGRFDAPRCCKRDAMTAIESAKRQFGCLGSTDGFRYVCGQFSDNSKCIKARCPYYPAGK